MVWVPWQRMCFGEIREVSAVVSTRVRQWNETDTGRMVDVTAPDNILVNGTLSNGAVASAHVSSAPSNGTGYGLQVYGREGTLAPTSQKSASIGVRLQGGKGDGSALEEIPILPYHS